MPASTSELRIPADLAYIVVAKRAAAGFATVAGFDIEAVHDLVIAVTQACENAIGCAHEAGGDGHGQLRLTFTLEDQRLDVQVRSSCTRAEIEAESVARHHAVARKHEEIVAAAAANDLALRLMGLFVDDFGYRLDERGGGLRVRLTKYRVT